jgi:hypothetical protein
MSKQFEPFLDCGFDIAFKGSGSWGSTPLHIPAWFGQAEVVEFLLSRGSPIDIPASSPVESLPLSWGLTVRPIAAIQRETICKSCAHCSQPERILHLIRLRWRVRRWPRLSTPRGQEGATENRPK